MLKSQPNAQEAYVHNYDGPATEQVFGARTAQIEGAFILPHLQPNMDLLDCGSGPGTITAGFAQTLSLGTVTGLELAQSQVEAAQENVAKLGLTNVRFEQGSAYELPYSDNRFDAVFSHAMLEHLQDPVMAVRELLRVLKPGGVIGIRCADLGMSQITPVDATLDKAYDIWLKYRKHLGGDPWLGHRCRSLLREAGFSKTIGTASCETWGTIQATQSVKVVLQDEFAGQNIAETAIQLGWADQHQMGNTVTALDDWGKHPDALFALVWCEAVAWKKNTK